MKGALITKPYSSDKLRKNILLATGHCKLPAGHAEEIADAVVRDVEQWLGSRDSATTEDIRRIASSTLEKLHPEVAEFYKEADHII